jgi:hypothetical protein
MPVLSAPRLRLWPPRTLASKPACAARAWMIRATVPGSIARLPTRGRGGVAAVAAARRGPDPPEDRAFGDPGRFLPGPQGADRAEFAGPVREGHGNAAAGTLALGVQQGQAQAAFAGLEVFNLDGSELGAAERAGETRQ